MEKRCKTCLFSDPPCYCVGKKHYSEDEKYYCHAWGSYFWDSPYWRCYKWMEKVVE